MPKETPAPPYVVDERDLLLLQALRADGRASHRDLAATTGMSLTTVNRRIRNLEEEGIIRGYTVDIAADRVGWGITVAVGLRIEKGHLPQVQKQIATDPRVFGVYDVTGEWDGLVLARTKDRADLDDLAKTTLSAAHIQRTNTMVVLGTVLEQAGADVPPS